MNGVCLDDRHCSDLPNTVCGENLFQGEGSYCVCRQGAAPIERDPENGMH